MTHPPSDRPRIHLDLTEGEAADVMGDLPLGHSVTQATRDLYVHLREALRKSAHRVPMPRDPVDDMEFPTMQPTRPWPDKPPRRGHIVRKHDVTGISGVGVIAEFCVFSDGFTVIRWLDGPPQYQPKFETYDKPGIDPFIQISGHNG